MKIHSARELTVRIHALAQAQATELAASSLEVPLAYYRDRSLFDWERNELLRATLLALREPLRKIEGFGVRLEPEASVCLRPEARDWFARVRTATLLAMRRLGAQLPSGVSRDGTVHYRSTLARVLGDDSRSESLEWLERLATDESATVRGAAHAALDGYAQVSAVLHVILARLLAAGS